MIQGEGARRWRAALAMLTAAGLAAAGPGCDPINLGKNKAAAAAGKPAGPAGRPLPPAYTSNQITDPALLEIAEGIKAWGLRQVGPDKEPLYSKVEVVPPVPIVQPYGVGVYQADPRLPVILTTAPAWKNLSHADKEAAVAEAFNHISEVLKGLRHTTPLPPTLSVQTPQGMSLAWINRLEENGKNVHGDD